MRPKFAIARADLCRSAVVAPAVAAAAAGGTAITSWITAGRPSPLLPAFLLAGFLIGAVVFYALFGNRRRRPLATKAPDVRLQALKSRLTLLIIAGTRATMSTIIDEISPDDADTARLNELQADMAALENAFASLTTYDAADQSAKALLLDLVRQAREAVASAQHRLDTSDVHCED